MNNGSVSVWILDNGMFTFESDNSLAVQELAVALGYDPAVDLGLDYDAIDTADISKARALEVIARLNELGVQVMPCTDETQQALNA